MFDLEIGEQVHIYMHTRYRLRVILMFFFFFGRIARWDVESEKKMVMLGGRSYLAFLFHFNSSHLSKRDIHNTKTASIIKPKIHN